jgi:hypothetical protein
MSSGKTRFKKVALKDLKKIVPEVLDGHGNHKDNPKGQSGKKRATVKQKPKA